MNAAMGKSHGALAEGGPVTPLKRKIAAILAADVAGYSRLVAEDEERTLHDLAAARAVFDALVAKGGGRIFNTAGDSVMCEFDSAVEAVRVAVDIQDTLRARNAGVDKRRRLEFRMGLTIGDVVDRDGDLLGDGVNIAARLESLAPPGGVCVSRSVHEAVANKLSVQFRELGIRHVKNIPQPVHAYVVAMAGAEPDPSDAVALRPSVASAPHADANPLPWRLAAGALGVVVVWAGVTVGRPAVDWIRGGGSPATETVGPARDDAKGSGRNDAKGDAKSDTRSDAKGEMATPHPAAATPPASAPSGTAASRSQTRPGAASEPVASRPVRQITRDGKADGAAREPAPAGAAKPEAAVVPKPEAGAPKADSRRELPSDPAAAFSALSRDDVVGDPRTLAEYYHNGRVLEARGDRSAALAALAAAAPLAGNALDPLLRYGALLRATKGQAAARQAFAALARSNPSDAASLLVALSAEGDDRRVRLEAYQAEHPDDAVADYFVAEALLDGRGDEPTLTEKRLAFDDYDSFLEAASSGALAGRFVDRAVLDAWVDGARRRRGEIETAFANGTSRPAATFTRSPAGWIARVALPEAATSATVRIGERGEPIVARLGDRTGGKPAAEVDLPPNAARATLYVSYTDKAGREAGPFPLPFDPAAATVDGSRAALDRFPDSWVQFRPDMPDLLSYAGLVSNRCAIARASIGFGGDAPRQPLPLPPCDATGPAAMPSSASLLRLPEGTDSVQVQLTFADGSESLVRTFTRP